ncbi:alpha/beta fold hydrolase [Paenibacillus herberti]|nr:alpha/beta hydrolase [Paenibacillus herberti]
MSWVTTDDGVTLYVHQSGPARGRTVLLLHGWPLNHRMFDRQLAFLPESGLRCAAPDLRGFGRSHAPSGGYCCDRLADDLRDVINSLCLDEVILAGFSSGAAAAVRYMSRHGGKGVAGLALISPATPSLIKRDGWPFGLPPEQLDRLIQHAGLDRPQMAATFARQMFYRYHSPEYMSWFANLAMDGSLSATLSLARSLRDEDQLEDLPYIRVPIAIMYGVHDRIVPAEASLQLAAALPNADVIRFEKSGHGLFQDEAERFQQELVQFALRVP